MGYRNETELVEQWQRHRVAVRRLHEKLFYRPLLNAVARLDSGDARLSLEAASERLTALGYLDPEGRSGTSRPCRRVSVGVRRFSARCCPCCSDGSPTPQIPMWGCWDSVEFRRNSVGRLGTCGYCAMSRRPPSVLRICCRPHAWQRTCCYVRPGCRPAGDVKELEPKSLEDLLREMSATAMRYDEPDRAVQAIRTVRSRELFRVAAADANGLLGVPGVCQTQRYLRCHDLGCPADRGGFS